MSDSRISVQRPWGLSRMAPCLSPSTLWPSSMVVDPETQVGEYFGIDDQPMPFMASARGKHGSLDQSQTPQTTNMDGKKVSDGSKSDQKTD